MEEWQIAAIIYGTFTLDSPQQEIVGVSEVTSLQYSQITDSYREGRHQQLFAHIRNMIMQIVQFEETAPTLQILVDKLRYGNEVN